MLVWDVFINMVGSFCGLILLDFNNDWRINDDNYLFLMDLKIKYIYDFK